MQVSNLGNVHMVTTLKTITADQIAAREAQNRLDEIHGGQWVESNQLTGEQHGRIEANILFKLMLFVRANKAGRVYPGDTTFVLEGEPGHILTMRRPDVAFVSVERVQERDDYYYQAPDLAVEIISPSETVQEIQDKLDDYLRTGVREIWQVYPSSRQVIVYKIDGHPVIYTSEQSITTDLLPGFEMTVQEMFEE